MARILFVHNGLERFVKDDLRLLRETHTVTDWYQPKRQFNPFRLYRLLHEQDVVFCWFASWHSLFPVWFARLVRKPAVVVVGGYDTANIPQAGYGAQRGGLPRMVSHWIAANATHLLVNSQSARKETIANTAADARKIAVIYHGIEPFPVGPLEGRERLAITVGGVDQTNLLRKGLLPFVKAADCLPDVHFTLAGRWSDNSIETLKQQASPNVTFAGFLSDTDLNQLYARASVYVQASLHEGFGLSLAEAMSAGCIPVVTRAGSLPEVVGDCGIYVDSTEPAVIATAVQSALDAPQTLRQAACQRIRDMFPMQRRRESLNQLLANLTPTR